MTVDTTLAAQIVYYMMRLRLWFRGDKRRERLGNKFLDTKDDKCYVETENK